MRAQEFVSEKWSEKYKRSIDCSHPRGFSQRAHCAGRRKNEDVAEGWKDIVAGGAMALGAMGAGAQTIPNVNAQQVELANKYYNVLVQRAKEDGRELDRRTLNLLKAKAADAAAQKFQQNTPQQQNTFPSQGSERKVSKDIGQFESQGVAEEQLDELTFKGSPCTKDCSGHRAGYEWSRRKGGRDAASWSRSFNNGAALFKNGY